MKYNIQVEVNHFKDGYLGTGSFYREMQQCERHEMERILRLISENGVRENGVTMWQQNTLIAFGKTITDSCTLHMWIVEEE